MTTEEKLDRLIVVADGLASSVTAHDAQIASLIKIGQDDAVRLRELTEAIAKHDAAIAGLERQWLAYINTLPRQ